MGEIACSTAARVEGICRGGEVTVWTSARAGWTLGALSVGVLAVRALLMTFVCDDAYISFRYVRNLVEGRGLVFNPGEWVEGYSNLLWVLQLGAIWKVLGVEPPTASIALSLGCTALTVALTAWWARRWAPEGRHGRAVVLALLLLCTRLSFAEWSTSGLETRQYTLLVVSAFALATVGTVRATAAASVALGLAVASRPEGFALAALCLPLLAWGPGPSARRVAAALVPAATLGGAVLLFRWTTYGAWVPNTVVAKAVGAWPSMGLTYFAVATIESALYLLVPLGVWGVLLRARDSGNRADLLGPVCLLGQGAAVVWAGGDHFAFRMLDWWWPLLAVGAATALARAADPRRAWLAAGVVTVYGSALEVTHQVAVATQTGRPAHAGIEAARYPYLWLVPGLPLLLPAYNRAGRATTSHLVAVRHHRHAWFARDQLRRYAPYLEVRDQLGLPADAVARRGSVGVMPWCLPDLVVIDEHGLTDAVVARAPVPDDYSRRQLAHERSPPKGYLAERGVNLVVRGATRTVEEALADYPFALPLGEHLVMPFESGQSAWVERSFGDRDLASRVTGSRAESNRLRIGGRRWRGSALLGSFEGEEGWVAADGSSWWRQPGDHLTGEVGAHLLDSRDPTAGAASTIEITSPPFVGRAGRLLALRWGGQRGGRVELVAGGEVLQTWKGRNPEELRFGWADLSALEGRELRLRVVDDAPDGFVLLDHALLLDLEPASVTL